MRNEGSWVDKKKNSEIKIKSWENPIYIIEEAGLHSVWNYFVKHIVCGFKYNFKNRLEILYNAGINSFIFLGKVQKYSNQTFLTNH